MFNRYRLINIAVLIFFLSFLVGAGYFYGCGFLDWFCGTDNGLELYLFPLQLGIIAGIINAKFFAEEASPVFIYAVLLLPASIFLSAVWVKTKKKLFFFIAYVVLSIVMSLTSGLIIRSFLKPSVEQFDSGLTTGR